jgi:hypothetical protein
MMSAQALTAVFRFLQVCELESCSRRFVLAALADTEVDGVCRTNAETLSDVTTCDLGTVPSELEAGKLIEDTGERSGATRQIKAYRLKLPVSEELQKCPALTEPKEDKNVLLQQKCPASKPDKNIHLYPPTP